MSKQYFIADVRKEQIMLAAIDALTEFGFVKTSLSKIGKKAKTSTGLISYHFSGKEDLMNHTLMHLAGQEKAFVLERVNDGMTSAEKLAGFIEAGVAYRGVKRKNTLALLEIAFNMRTPANVPYFREEMHPEEELQLLLLDILSEGQKSGEFGAFDVTVVAMMIRGSISLSVSLPQLEEDPEFKGYSGSVIKQVLKMIQ